MQALMQRHMPVMLTAAMQPVLRSWQLFHYPQMAQQQQQQKAVHMLRKGLRATHSAPSLQVQPHSRLHPCLHGLLQLMPRGLQQQHQRMAWLLNWTAVALRAAQ
jgi:hypothetical protein